MMFNFLRLVVLLVLVSSILCQYYQTSSCSASGCTLTCNSDTIHLSDIVLSTNNVQTIYSRMPSTIYSTGDAWLDDDFRSHSLGLYKGQWSYGSYNGVFALNTQYTDGDYCDGLGNRSTNIYLACDPNHSASNPLISMSEPSRCQYSILLAYSGLCSVNDDSSSSSHSTTQDDPNVDNGTDNNNNHSSTQDDPNDDNGNDNNNNGNGGTTDSNSSSSSETMLPWQTIYIVLIPVGSLIIFCIIANVLYCRCYRSSPVYAGVPFTTTTPQAELVPNGVPLSNNESNITMAHAEYAA